jgi:hypothetical protein
MQGCCLHTGINRGLVAWAMPVTTHAICVVAGAAALAAQLPNMLGTAAVSFVLGRCLPLHQEALEVCRRQCSGAAAASHVFYA